MGRLRMEMGRECLRGLGNLGFISFGVRVVLIPDVFVG